MSKAKNVNLEFGRRLKELRIKKGLSRPQLTKLVFEDYNEFGNDNMIYRYENGENKIKEKISKRLADALGCDPLYFTDEDFRYPTRNDEFAAVMKKCNEENYYMHLAIVSLLKLNGYDVEINELPKKGNIDEVFKIMKRHIVVSKDERELFTLGIQEANKLGNNLDKNFNVLLSYYLKDEV